MECTIICANIQKDAGHEKAKKVALFVCGKFERRTIERGTRTMARLTVMPNYDDRMMPRPVSGEVDVSYNTQGPPRPTPNL